MTNKIKNEEKYEDKMKKEDCVFCKIVKGEINPVKIFEDKDFLAILDKNPNIEGMTLVLTKEHYDSYMFDLPESVYKKFLITTKKVVKILEKGLDTKRVAMVMEGMGINHAHIKLYPLHGINEKFKEIWAKEKVYFEKYLGYISTQLGPEKSDEELNIVAKKILENQK